MNSINSYFQDANPSQKAYYWYEWKYKIGDRILFNESKRFPMLYNNLKGVILDIDDSDNFLKFTVRVEKELNPKIKKVEEKELFYTSHNRNVY